MTTGITANANRQAPPVISTSPAVTGTRLIAIDALRGLVMLFMLVDHVRETWFIHMQVSDPADAHITDPTLFFTRLLSTFCAPVFIVLTGLSAWLYGQSRTKHEVSSFLVKRGLFLIFLELTFVGFAWTAKFPPSTLWLQVIWAIGLCMVALAGLIYLPRLWQVVLGLVIVCGHNLLDGIVLTPDSPSYALWAILHQRSVIELGHGMVAKTTYPILPWIGVILLGYAARPWFAKNSNPLVRHKRLLMLGWGLILGFFVIRYLNFYGDKLWFHAETPLRTVMSFLALTKYPPSLLFLMPTIGFGVLMLALFERHRNHWTMPVLAMLGGAPMFYYLLHLYMLKALYLCAVAIYGLNKGQFFGVGNVVWVWAWVAILVVPLYLPTRWFAGVKQRRKDIWWLKYL